MRSLLLCLMVWISSSSMALADPAWFDRPQATYTASHLDQVYNSFLRELSWEVGANHPLYRESYYAERTMRVLYQELRTNYPFDPLYSHEMSYYRNDWQRVKREWYYARLPDRQLQQIYADLQFLSDKLHRTFNATPPPPPPPRWIGSCRVILETVWGQDLQNFYGQSRASSRQEAINAARADGVRQCEYVRGNDNLKQCTVDQGQCNAVQGQ